MRPIPTPTRTRQRTRMLHRGRFHGSGARRVVLALTAATLAVLMPVAGLAANPQEKKDAVDEREIGRAHV